MAEKKKQHFVPQFYLRNFSGDADRKRISLFVIESGRHVSAAPIRDQAYDDYLYGKGGVEDDLGKLEEASSPVIAAAIADNRLPQSGSEAHQGLLTFVLFQAARTPTTGSELARQSEEILKKVAARFEDLIEKVDSIEIDERATLLNSLNIASAMRTVTMDLQAKLLINKTARLFFTSDHPVIRYNQFLEKRNLLASNTGFACKGLQLFLPLGPRHLLLFYDADVYRVGGRRHWEPTADVTSDSDVAVFNSLQAANADEVLYFSQATVPDHVAEAVTQAKPFRRTDRTVAEELPAVGPDGEIGTLIHSSAADLRMGIKLDVCVITPAAAGAKLPGVRVHFRNPGLVHRFEAARMQVGPYDARQILDEVLIGK